MNNTELMNDCLESLRNSINEQISPADSTALIGLDSWGSWLASELGFRLEIPSFGITLRGISDSRVKYDIEYRETDSRLSDLNLKTAILVTDISVTFGAVKRAKHLITESCKFRSSPEFWVASLISASPNAASEENKKEFSRVFDVLGGFPIPVVSASEFPIRLPDQQLLSR
jgi:hypothetical protein